MTRAALALLLTFALLYALGLVLFSGVARAGDSVDMASLVPQEWRVSVFEVTCTDLLDCCGWHRLCGDGYQRTPDPAPIPLPWPGLLLTAALAAMIWKGKRHGRTS